MSSDSAAAALELPQAREPTRQRSVSRGWRDDWLFFCAACTWRTRLLCHQFLAGGLSLSGCFSLGPLGGWRSDGTNVMLILSEAFMQRLFRIDLGIVVLP